MASTTKTENLKLSQFVGTDKPAWLTDYNGDMKKIDDGYKKLEDANTATQADLDITKQDLAGSQTDINDVKASVQALEAQDIALGNRLTVVEGNYDTMHHEVAINKQSIEDIDTDLGADEALTTTATTVHGAINELNDSLQYFTVYISNTGNDDNDGRTETTPMKTFRAVSRKYKNKSIRFKLAGGVYEENIDLHSTYVAIVGSGKDNTTIKGNIVVMGALVIAESTLESKSIEVTRAMIQNNCSVKLMGDSTFRGDNFIFDKAIVDLNGFKLSTFTGTEFIFNTTNQVIDSVGTGKLVIHNSLARLAYGMEIPVIADAGSVIYYKTGMNVTKVETAMLIQYT